MLGTEELTAAEKKFGLPAGWLQQLLQQFGPILVQALISFLGGLLTPPTVVTATAKMKCPDEELGCLDKIICDQTQALVGMIKHRNCCECG